MFNEEEAAVYKTLVDIFEQSGMLDNRSRCMILANEVLLSGKLSISMSTVKEEHTDA